MGDKIHHSLNSDSVDFVLANSFQADKVSVFTASVKSTAECVTLDST